ncbi:MAG TPA: response regulator [Candidatus Acidoferrales bacterium]|nr:response regulator [Candidatus Acidoferrales bacterium]
MSMQEKANILMVDDQPGKLLSYEAILNELGENLIKANSGREALEYLLKNDIAVVLMDVSMPELDGFELAEMIRQHPRFQKTAIIFISAVHLTDLDRLKGYQRGAVDYISVPVVPELLRAKVSVFAELHRKTQQLEVLNAELRRLSSSLIASQDEERRRIARELHDGLGQDLVAIKMMLDGILQQEHSAAKKQVASDVSTLIDRTIQQVRSISHLLHPPLLDEVGLRAALKWYLEGFSKRSGIETELDVQPASFPRIAPELETAVFRIVQEALTNVFRHSGARKGWVTVAKEENQVVVTVRDDGKGISDRVVEFRPESIGIGIGGMRQRVKEFGGELQLRNSNPGAIVEVIIPIKLPAAYDQQIPVAVQAPADDATRSTV